MRELCSYFNNNQCDLAGQNIGCRGEKPRCLYPSKYRPANQVGVYMPGESKPWLVGTSEQLAVVKDIPGVEVRPIKSIAMEIAMPILGLRLAEINERGFE